MATKAYIEHAYKVLEDTAHYKLIDVFNALCVISRQVDDKEAGKSYFVVRSSSPSVYSLYKAVSIEFPHIDNRTTVTSCLNHLKELGIIDYNINLKGWEILDMGNMFKRKDAAKDLDQTKSGYIKLRDYLFTKEFYDLPISDKKIVYLSVCLMSSKGYSDDNGLLIANLRIHDSLWIKCLNTTNIYYAAAIIKRTIETYGLFKDYSSQKRHNELQSRHNRERYIGLERLKKIKKELDFKFFFKPLMLLAKNIIQDNNINPYLKKLIEKCKDYYIYIKNRIYAEGPEIEDKFTTQLMIAMLANTRYLGWEIQDRLLDRVITKLNSESNKIYSPDKFINAVLKTMI